MFFLGTTYPGRIIVGTNYAYEFCTPALKEHIQPIGQYAQGVTLILTALYFQTISKQVLYLELANFLFISYLIAQSFFFPESPRWDYSKEKYDDSRVGLQTVANFNANKEFTRKFKFDTEKEMEDVKSMHDDAKTVVQLDGGNEYGITTR